MSAELPDALKIDLAFANGNTHQELGSRVAKLLGLEPSPLETRRFADTESYVRYEDSVRGKHVLAFQTHAPVDNYSVADAFYEHLQMIDAAIRGHASKVTAIAPNFAGARQDRQVLPREAVSADLNLDLLQHAGASHFVTVDIHDIHTLNSFRKPGVADQLTAQPMLRSKLSELITGDPSGYVMISPDEGHSKTIRKHAEALGIDLKDMIKNRDPKGEIVSHEGNIDDIDGRVCLIMDDMIGTGKTLVSAAEKLHDSGSSAIYVAATHGWFSGLAATKLKQAPIDTIFVTDTIPISEEVRGELGESLQVVSAAKIIADGLRRILTDESVSGLYEGQNYF